MADNEKWVWFNDEDPIAGLFTPAKPEAGLNLFEEIAPEAPKAPAGPGLSEAIQLHLGGKSQEALEALSRVLKEGKESKATVHATMGNIRFSLGQYDDAADSYLAAAREKDQKTASYNAGVCLERAGRYEEAAGAFRQACIDDPSRQEAAFGLGVCLLHLKQAEPALDAFHQSLRIKVDFHGEFGKAVALHLAGKLDEAEAIYRKLLVSAPKSVELLSNLVAIGIARKDRKLITEFADPLLAIQPSSPLGLQGLASAAFTANDYESALKHCQKLVESTPDSFEGWFNLGVALQATGRLDRAADAYSHAVGIRPEAIAFANLGLVQQQQNDLSAAGRSYERALQLSPELPGPMWNLALLAERSGDLEQAEGLYGRITAKHSSWEEAWFRLGYLRLQRSDYRGGAEAFDQCLKRRAQWADARMNLGLAHWRLGDQEAARRDFEEALKLQPKAIEAVRALAAFAIAREDYEQAFDLQTKLIELGDRSAEVFYNTGLLLQKSGMHQDAVKYYQEALNEKPNIAEALLNMGHALKALGQESEARSCWKKALEANPELAATYFSN